MTRTFAKKAIESVAVSGCVECGTSPGKSGLRRDRCDRCYRSLLRDLKEAGTYVNPHRPLLDRLLDNGVPGWGGCILWIGHLNANGYGTISVDGVPRLAHRVAYELLVGPVPEGMPLDHTCHNRETTCPGGPKCLHRRCINPGHLEAVTQRENLLRSPRALTSVNARKTHCHVGHPFDEANTYYRTRGGRQCRQCGRERARGRRTTPVRRDIPVCEGHRNDAVVFIWRWKDGGPR